MAITVTNVNTAPVFDSGTTGSIAENSPIATTAYDANAHDDGENNGTLTYSLSAGGDNDLFNINSSTGVVTFKVSPDFEAPADAGGNNVYDITVHANDGTLDTTRNVAIAVTDLVPVAVGDILLTNLGGNAYSVPEWTFLSNDSDPDGNPIDMNDVTDETSLNSVGHTAGIGTQRHRRHQ